MIEPDSTTAGGMGGGSDCAAGGAGGVGVGKPVALASKGGVEDIVVPADVYVLVKRFSAKEETRRVVAAVYDPSRVKAKRVGFENHLNYFHSKGEGLPASLSRIILISSDKKRLSHKRQPLFFVCHHPVFKKMSLNGLLVFFPRGTF